MSHPRHEAHEPVAIAAPRVITGTRELQEAARDMAAPRHVEPVEGRDPRGFLGHHVLPAEHHHRRKEEPAEERKPAHVSSGLGQARRAGQEHAKRVGHRLTGWSSKPINSEVAEAARRRDAAGSTRDRHKLGQELAELTRTPGSGGSNPGSNTQAGTANTQHALRATPASRPLSQHTQA